MNGNRFGVIELILRDVCEMERDDPDMQDTICIDISTLKRILDNRAGEVIEAMAVAIVEIEQLETNNTELRKALASTQSAQPSSAAVPEAPEDTVSNRRAIVGAPGSAIALMQALQRRIKELEAKAPPAPAKPRPLTENRLMKCLTRAGCYGNVKLTFESGPYDIDRPTLNATKLCAEIEAAHNIKEPT